MACDVIVMSVYCFLSQITFPDFHLYEMLDQHKHLVPNCLDDPSNLQAFVERFEVWSQTRI